MVMSKDLGGTPRSAGGITGGAGRNVSKINKNGSAAPAEKITTGKEKSIAREEAYGTPSYKIAKQNDSFVNQYAKYAKKSGSTLQGNQALAKSVAPKSVSAKQKSVPVKRTSGSK